MRNYIAKKYDLNIKNTMVIIDPKDFERIMEILQKNEKYI
jgi:hypothetical protein